MISSVGVIRLIVEPDDTGFHAFSPTLKGLHADGATVHEAAQNFIDAIPAYLESLVKHMADSAECRMTQPESGTLPSPLRVTNGDPAMICSRCKRRVIWLTSCCKESEYAY